MTTTITNVRPVDLGDAEPSANVDVEFDSTITAIRPAGTAAAIGHVIDGGGRFLMPGLIDTHVHLGSRDAVEAAARAGVTTLVDLGTHPDELIATQRAGHGVPAIISAGCAASAPGSLQIDVMGFPAAGGVADPADAQRYLDWRTAHGSDLIKIIIEDPATTDVPALSVATIAALVDGARRRGLLTVAHVVTAAAFDRGLDAGVDILTHAPLDRPLPDTTVRRMVDSGTVSSPTLVMMRAMARARLGDRAAAAFQNSLDSVCRMHAAGVKIVAGTDANETAIAPVPHGESLHDEIALLRTAGMTTTRALRAATSDAASSLHLADRGSLTVGSRADLLLAGTTDPIADPAAISRPTAIWIGGTVIGDSGD